MVLLPSSRGFGRELSSFRERMNRLFEEFFDRGSGLVPFAGVGEWIPALDVSETDEAVIVRAELPGMDPEDVDISVTANVLSIKGEKKEELSEEKKHYHRVERSYGAFSRSVTLPATIDATRVKASYAKGILEVTLPKKEQAKAKRIKIEVK